MTITLSNMGQFSLQDIYNQGVTHLLTQNRPSIHFDKDGEEHCLYRGPDGLKCVAGAFMTDSEYDEGMEGSDFEYAASRCPTSTATKEQVGLMMAMQRIHDGVLYLEEPAKVWAKRLKGLADEAGLEMPQILQDKLKAIA